jgi:hypothetical protein
VRTVDRFPLNGRLLAPQRDSRRHCRENNDGQKDGDGQQDNRPRNAGIVRPFLHPVLIRERGKMVEPLFNGPVVHFWASHG